jgi:hypothetical protein
MIRHCSLGGAAQQRGVVEPESDAFRNYQNFLFSGSMASENAYRVAAENRLERGAELGFKGTAECLYPSRLVI